MPCAGCGTQKEVSKEPQRAVRFRAALSGGVVFEGDGPKCWLILRDRCWNERRFLLAGRVSFNDGASRNFGGWSWSYMIEDGESWTIDDDASADRIMLKYRAPVLIPGGTVIDPEIKAAQRLLEGAE